MCYEGDGYDMFYGRKGFCNICDTVKEVITCVRVNIVTSES